MSAVLQALTRAFGQLDDPAILAVVIRSVLVTLVIFAALAVGLYAGLMWVIAWAGLSDAGGGVGAWAGAALAVILAVIAGWLLFRVIALAVLQFFADKVVAAVEARHYPEAASTARKLPFAEELANSLRGVGRTIGLNLLALPVAGVLLITGIGPAIVFLGVNAWLLGRELTDMVWLRYCSAPDEPSPVPRAERLMLGGAIAGIMLVPLVNLVAPILGAAAGTHLAHGAMARRIEAEGVRLEEPHE